MKKLFWIVVLSIATVSFAYGQDGLEYEIQISGTYEAAVEGGAKKWTSWVPLDHSLISFGTERVADENVPDEFPISGDYIQEWYVNFDATGIGDRLITFVFNPDTMPFVSVKGKEVYALRYKVKASQKFSEIETAVIDNKPGKPRKG